VAEISAKDVKTLRERTGAGMMDCRNALRDAEGDMEKAIEVLRERGLAKADKRSGRETSEGAIGIATAGGSAGIIELGCETDFVAKTDEFQALAQSVADAVAESKAETVEQAQALALGGGTIESEVTAAIAKVGENVALKRVGRLAAKEGVAGGYVHAGGKLGVIVALESAAGDTPALQTLAKDLSMHVAAIDPTPVSIDRDGVPAAHIEKEREILRNQALQSGKPEKVVDKIVDGRMNKFFSEHCLLEQAFVKDPDLSIAQLVEKVAGDAGAEIKIGGFLRFRLGEASAE